MKKEFQSCPTCGAGFLSKIKDTHEYVCSACEAHFVDCSICNGKGYYQAGWRGETEADFENCQHCKGTGYILKKDDK